MRSKMFMRPKSGLSMKILRLMLGDKQLKQLVDAYMKTKQKMILNELVDKIQLSQRKEGNKLFQIKPIIKIELVK